MVFQGWFTGRHSGHLEVETLLSPHCVILVFFPETCAKGGEKKLKLTDHVDGSIKSAL